LQSLLVGKSAMFIATAVAARAERVGVEVQTVTAKMEIGAGFELFAVLALFARRVKRSS
jgi:hypothetical protein